MATIIYINTAINSFSDNQTRYFLDYLKLRQASKKRCGGFSLMQMIEILGMSERTSRKHLSALLKAGYIVKCKTNFYRIVSQKKLAGNYQRCLGIKVEESFINQFSWKNIASFRAFLTELIIQRNRRYRITARKGYTVKNQKDKSVEKIRNRSSVVLDNLMASTYVSCLIKKHYSTCLRYRKRQNVSEYYNKGLIDTNIIADSDNAQEKALLHGKIFFYKGRSYFSSISERKFSLELGRY